MLLLGHPVAHSLSPVMQNAAFAAAGLRHEYIATDVDAAQLPGAVAGLREGHLGANVTVPHKAAVLDLMDSLEPGADAIGAVNTIVARDGALAGHNTDVHGAWEGLVAPARDALADAVVALLGAGGGARALVLALVRLEQQRPREVIVVARREAAAAEVAGLGADAGLTTRSAPWDQLASVVAAARVVVNATPLGLSGDDPIAAERLGGRAVLDLAYRPGGTDLVRRARAEGGWALQGDAMLLHQGAAAFSLWTGVPAPLDAMAAALEQGLRV